MQVGLVSGIILGFALAGNLSAGAQATDISAADVADANRILTYVRPASCWNEALPLGNGRLGAMVYGRPSDECITFNEATFWAGSPHTNHNPAGAGALPEIRQLLFEKKFEEAKNLIDSSMLSRNGHGMMFVPAANLRIAMNNVGVENTYFQSLDLRTGVHNASWEQNGIRYERESFVSYTDDIFVLRMTCDRKQALSATISLDTPLTGSISRPDESTIQLIESSPNLEGVEGAVKLNAYVRVTVDYGLLLNVGNSIKVKRAKGFTVIVSMRTNFHDYANLTENPERALPELDAACQKGYDSLKQEHVDAFSQLADRSVLKLNHGKEADLPTDLRLKIMLPTLRCPHFSITSAATC